MHRQIKQELQNGLFSAIQISHRSPADYDSFFQGFTTDKLQIPINQSTQFDLASITKALFTAPAFYHLFSQKKIAPETKASQFFPQLPNNITILSLLNHSVGLPAWIPFYEEQSLSNNYQDRKESIIDTISHLTPDYKKRYSDLTFLLLGFILEEIHRKPLQTIFQQLKKEINTTSMLRYAVPYIEKEESVATMFSSIRNRVCHGEVEDENCYWLGGVTGHAGLFGSADDVVHWIFALLETEWFSEWLDRTNRAGFDVPEPPESSYGDFVSGDSVGHLGFTGTAFLFSKLEKSATVVLTNRTHTNPNKDEWKQRIKKIRRQAFLHHHHHRPLLQSHTLHTHIHRHHHPESEENQQDQPIKKR